jgi:hypothetical protein
MRLAFAMVALRVGDAVVFAAYGWPEAISDDDILAKLLALNVERSRGAKKKA